MIFYHITIFIYFFLQLNLTRSNLTDKNVSNETVYQLFDKVIDNNPFASSLNTTRTKSHIKNNSLQFTSHSPISGTPGTIRCSPNIENVYNIPQKELFQRLTSPCRYDYLERPHILPIENTSSNAAVKVYLRAYIYSLKIIDANDLRLTIYCLLQLRYFDPRLSFGIYAPRRTQPIVGGSELSDRLWNPHIIFTHEFKPVIQNTYKKEVLTIISPDGVVTISAPVQTTLSCWKELNHLNEENCSSVISSWAHNSSDLILQWEKEVQPANVFSQINFQSMKYVLRNVWRNESIESVAISKAPQGLFVGSNFSSISLTVHLMKQNEYYIMNYFIPSIMIVAISWVSFWLQADQTPARTTLGTSTMLSFITLTSTQEKSFPNKSYSKICEVWFFGCTSFIFGTLIEFAFVNSIWRRHQNITLKKLNYKYILRSTISPKTISKENVVEAESATCSSKSKNTIFLVKTSLTDAVDSKVHPQNQEQLQYKANNSFTNSINDEYSQFTMTPHEVSLWIDKKARFMFPLTFIVFNAIFWAYVYYM